MSDPLETHFMIAFSQDQDCLNILADLADQEGLETECVQNGNVDDCLKWLETNIPPEFCLIDMSGEPDPLDTIRDIHAEYGKDMRVIAIGSQNKIGFTIRMREAGAESYLVKPLNLTELRESLELKPLRGSHRTRPHPGNDTPDPKPSTAKNNVLVTFIGARGGVGASTLAANYAYTITEKHDPETPVKVLIIDFDLEYGNLSLHFNTDPGDTLRAILETPKRVDSHFLSGAFAEYNETLSVMASNIPIGEDIDMVEDIVGSLIRELMSQFTHVICDLPRHRLLDFADAAIMAHEIFIVSDLSLVGLRDSVRLRSTLERSGCKGEIRFVVNDPKGQPDQVEREQFVRAIGKPIDFSVLYEGSAINRALNTGKPLAEVAPHSKILPVLEKMAGRNVVEKPETFLEKASRWLMGD